MGKAMTMLMMANGGNRSNERRNENYDRRNEYDRQNGGYDRRNESESRRSEMEYRQNEMENRRREGEYRQNEMESRRQEMQSRRNEYDGGSQDRYSQQYPMRDEMPEMRRRRDKRGRYMGEEEMRSGLYDGGEIGYKSENRRNALEGGRRQQVQAGGTFWMENPEDDEEFGKEQMMTWVKHMRDDEDQPIKPWTPDEIKPLARRFGYPTSGDEFDDFYTAIHMMKSDYCSVAEEFDVDTPAYYAALADAWLKDPDAKLKGRKKLEAYHKHIVKGK